MTVSHEAQLLEMLRDSGALDVAHPVRVVARASAEVEEGELASNEKRVHLVRHGQGFHNLLSDIFNDVHVRFGESLGNPYCHPALVDPPLTEIGREQARALRPKARALRPQPQLVVVSPMVRATQTAVIGFDHLLDGAATRVPFVAHEGCHEIAGVHICDRRRPLNDLRTDFPCVDYDTANISEEDPLWKEDVRESLTELADRGYAFLMWLRSRPEADIAVATHSTFLFALLNAAMRCEDEKLAAWFQTGEMRSLVLKFEDAEA